MERGRTARWDMFCRQNDRESVVTSGVGQPGGFVCRISDYWAWCCTGELATLFHVPSER